MYSLVERTILHSEQGLGEADVLSGRHRGYGTLSTHDTIVTITLNGERFDVPEPMTVEALLARLDIDARRVAVEHNRHILKRHRFTDVVVGDGDTLEIVNFVGGG